MPTCPFLGLPNDPQSVLSSASEDHCCYASGEPASVAIVDQDRFCLTAQHPQCPLFLRAQVRPPKPQPVILPPLLPNAPAVFRDSEDDRFESAPIHPPRDPLKTARAVIVSLVLLFVIAYFGWPLLAPTFIPSAPPPTALPTRTPTPTLPPTPTNTPRPTVPPTPTRLNQATPAPPEGGQLFSLNPSLNAVGWFASNERTGNHVNDPLLFVGTADKTTYYGLAQFDLSDIPAGTKVIYARLALVGARDERLGNAGAWQIKLVNLPAHQAWATLTFADVQALTWDYIVGNLPREALGRGQINLIEITGPALSALEKHFGQGKVTFRLEGPTESSDNLFVWDGGKDPQTGGYKPTLYVGTAALPTPTPAEMVVVPCVPTPSDPRARQALAATATFEATVFGTPTPYPPHYATPVLVTATPTAETIFAAATTAARATLQATTTGTATPIPPNWVTPFIVTPTPTAANQATATFVSVLATAQAATTGTPTPLPCFVWTATPIPPTPVIVLSSGTPQATPTPTATPAEIPPELRGKIVFSSDRGGSENLYVMNPDGTVIGRLSNRWAYDTARRRQLFTSDGALQLAVEGNQLVRTRIALYGPGNVLVKMLVDKDGINYDPSFAPDNLNIVFVSTFSGHEELYRINRNSNEFLQLTTSDWEWNKSPSWSPDGKQIVWMSNRVTGRRQIWIMNADGTNLRNLSNSNAQDYEPVWIR